MTTIEWTVQLRFVVALALGFLVGLERESTKIEQQKLVFGGVRTHPLISLLGFGCAWLHNVGAEFFLPAGMLAMTVLTGIAYVAKIKSERYGSTSEVSALLTFVTGALALLVDIWAAMALGVFNTILLSEKARLETYVENLNKVEFLATLKFLLVTMIILPVLPDRPFTRFELNPTAIWRIVILVSSIGFVGYFLSKKFGERVGLWLSGLLGGIVSSTAVTIAVGRLAQTSPQRGARALQAAILAGSVMYLRILVLVAIVSPIFVDPLWWKLVVLSVVGLALSFRVTRDGGEEHEPPPSLQNPFEITPALMFAVLFVVLLVATEMVRESMGLTGLYALGALVGVSDIDPFILSMIQVPSLGDIVVTAVLIAMMSNTVVKGVYFGFLVPGERRAVAWRYAVWAVAHVPLLLLG
ncbi:MAG: MgtC/SapB family protein [Bacteroidota bacterium]